MIDRDRPSQTPGGDKPGGDKPGADLPPKPHEFPEYEDMPTNLHEDGNPTKPDSNPNQPTEITTE